MDYCVLNGFLVVILIQHCTSEGLSTSNQSLSVVRLQGIRPLPREPDVPPADVLPVVAPPSLKEVQQVMQEASEQVEGHAAEEVLKELLEKVVEAARGQVEGGGEGKGDEAAVQKAVTEDALGADKGESDTKDVLEQEAEEEVVEGKDMGPEGGDTAAGKEQVLAEVDAFKDIAEEEERVVKKKGVTAAGSVEGTTAAGGSRAGAEVINESLDAGAGQEEKGAASEEAGGDLTAQEAEVEDGHEQVVSSKAKGPAGTETHKAEPTLRVRKVALGEEREDVGASDPGLAAAREEQPGDVGGTEGALAGETPADENGGETSPPDSKDMEITNTGAGGEEAEATGPDTGSKPGRRAEEGGAAAEEEAHGANASAATGGGRDGGSEASERSADKEGERAAGGEARDHPELREVLSPPGFDAEAPEERSPAPSPTPSVGEKSPDDEKSKRANEIVTSPDDLLPRDPAAAAQPTLDNLVTDVLAPGARSERNEAGWTNELVEDAAGAAEPGLEAWKIGAGAAAAFLVAETVVVLVYVVKRRSRSSAPARRRACEDGRVEPEEATGGDCSDDTLPADSEQRAALDPPDVASTLTHDSTEPREAGHAAAMSDFPSSAAGEAAHSGAELEELRTSVL